MHPRFERLLGYQGVHPQSERPRLVAEALLVHNSVINIGNPIEYTTNCSVICQDNLHNSLEGPAGFLESRNSNVTGVSSLSLIHGHTDPCRLRCLERSRCQKREA
jgi:hypothetical protein